MGALTSVLPHGKTPSRMLSRIVEPLLGDERINFVQSAQGSQQYLPSGVKGPTKRRKVLRFFNWRDF